MKTKSDNLPPGPRSRIPGKVFRELRRDPLAFFTKIAREYGDITSFYTIGQRYVVVNSPELAREILMGPAEVYWKGPALRNSRGILGDGLLTAEGEEHRRQRRMMQGSFHAKHVENYAGAIIESTREVIAAWLGRMKGGEGGRPEAIDLRAEMMGLTLVISGRALFGTFLANDIRTVHRCMDDLMNNYRRAVVPWGKILNRLPLPTTLKLRRAQQDLFGLVERMVAERRAAVRQGDKVEGGQGEAVSARPDLLSMMIAAADEPVAGCPHGGGGGAGGTRMTDAQLRDQCVTILTASHETTANAMTFTLYLLAKYPEEQRKLRAEVAAVLGEGEVTVEMLERMPRARWVLSESMRLYPPSWTMGRQNQVAVTLGGYAVPAKCTILIPTWTLHRNERYWEEPLAFVPERWREPKHPRFAYLPFSTGPRNCIGESFAWLEMMMALAMLVRGFEFSLEEGAADAGEMKLTPAITLRPRGAVVIRVALAPPPKGDR